MGTIYDFFHHFKCVYVYECIQPILLSTYCRPGIFLGMGIDGNQDRLGLCSQRFLVHEKQLVIGFCLLVWGGWAFFFFFAYLFAVSGDIQHLVG